VHSARRAMLFTWVVGLLVFINDSVNAVITGNAARDITAKYRVSREKLAYILDTTAAPVATFGPISDWIGYQCSMIAVGFAAAGITEVKPYTAFLHSIPWNFYCILALLAVPMIILGKDFGPMAQAEHRARTTGQLVAEGDTPLTSVEADLGQPVVGDAATVWNFVLPLATLIAVGVYALWYVGGGPDGKPLMDAFADTDVSIALTWAGFAMLLVGLLLALFHGVPLHECERITLGGFRTMLPALVIMVLAWSIGAVCNELNTAEVVVNATRHWLSPSLLPLLIFAVCMFLSFATGTSWGTMAIITPIAVPLAFELGGLALVYTIIGTVFAGAIFGDHCSPISDTTVLASTFAGSDHLAHVRTQIPYALVPAGLSAVLYVAMRAVANPFALLALGLGVQWMLIRVLGRASHRRLAAQISGEVDAL